MEEQPNAGNLLQPTAAGFLGLLKVLWVRAVRAWLPAYIVELKCGPLEVLVLSCGEEIKMTADDPGVCVHYLVEDSQQVL